MASINNTNSSCLLELYKAAESFKKNNKQEGLIHFEFFCKHTAEQGQTKDPASKIYRRIWKAMGQPMPHSHPNIAHGDFGRVAFHDQDGRTAPNAVKEQVLESYLIHLVQKELKKIAAQFRSGYNETAFIGFENLFKESDEIPLLKEIKNLIYNKTWERLGKPTDTHLAQIAHPDFGKVAFHNNENRSTTPQEKADAIDGSIRELCCRKFWNGLYQQADNYFRRNGSEIRPADTHNLPRIPVDEKSTMRKLFEGHQGICFGDVHADYFTVEFLYQHLDFLKEAGVKTLFMEHFYYEMQADLESFNRGEEPSPELITRCGDFDGALYRNYGITSQNHRTLIKAARARGIRIVGIDAKPASIMMEKDWQNGGRMEGMNYVATKIIDWEKKNGKFIVWLGGAHLTNMKIRETITFPSRSEMKEILIGLKAEKGDNELEKILEYSLNALAKQIFHDNEFTTKDYHFGLNEYVYLRHKSVIDKFIEILKTKIDVSQKEVVIPGVSELIQCPSFRTISNKNASWIELHRQNDSYWVCFKEQKTFGIASRSDANFDLVEKSKVATHALEGRRLVYA